MLDRQKRLNFQLEMQSVTVNYCTLLSATTHIYSYSVWVINTVCSLFRYFFIILFTAYTVNRHILVRFFLEIFGIL